MPPPPPPPQQADGSGGAGAVPDSYFTESKKGEVNELRNMLRNFATERDPQRKRDIIKKVIAYMTLGIDVSRLFTEMMLAIETRDLVIKKMVYLFLCNYATTHPDLAQMCTNTLVKDCGNDDPMVRGLALRSLCSLRLPQMVEYISEPLRRSLTDGHAYVRKTGVMGILKLHHLDADALEQTQMSDILYDMLRDPDAQVVSNCIVVLNEIMQSSGGMAINRAIMMHLLNRIHEFSEFGVIVVIELIPRYIPANDDEAYAIMTLLDPVLKTSNAGAVLAVIQAFLSISHHLEEDMTRHVLTRVKAPFVTLLSAGSSEFGHVHLQNAHALVDLCPGIFDDEYRQFYIKQGHDPSNVQYLKVSLLPKLANPSNAPDICAELAEHVFSVSEPKLSRLAVRAMTRIACRNVGGSGCEQSVALRLVEWLDSTVDHICSEAATALVNLVRRHPQLKEIIAPPLPRALKYNVQEPSGKASLIYLLGECGTDEAPYALEKVIDSYETEESTVVRMALLTATVQLFFQRPPEVQHMLGRLLAKVTDDVSNQDLHDRGLFYYRLLSSGGPEIESVVSAAVKAAPPPSDLFAEENDAPLRKELMKEFNTLSILYGNPSVNFVASKYQIPYVQLPTEHPLPPGAEDAGMVAPPPNPAPVPAPVAPEPVVAAPAADAGDMVDLLGFGGDPAPAPAAAPVAPATSLSLKAAVTMSGDEYQAAWEAIPDADALVTAIPLPTMPTLQWMEQTLASVHILTMASGELPTELKFYHYCCSDDIFYLIQSNITKGEEPLLIVTCKSQGVEKEALIEYMKSMLS